MRGTRRRLSQFTAGLRATARKSAMTSQRTICWSSQSR